MRRKRQQGTRGWGEGGEWGLRVSAEQLLCSAPEELASQQQLAPSVQTIQPSSEFLTRPSLAHKQGWLLAGVRAWSSALDVCPRSLTSRYSYLCFRGRQQEGPARGIWWDLLGTSELIRSSREKGWGGGTHQRRRGWRKEAENVPLAPQGKWHRWHVCSRNTRGRQQNYPVRETWLHEYRICW